MPDYIGEDARRVERSLQIEVERNGLLLVENSNLRADLHRIWDICHVPSSKHPKGGHAYTHFADDFDKIRAICLKWR